MRFSNRTCPWRSCWALVAFSRLLKTTKACPFIFRFFLTVISKISPYRVKRWNKECCMSIIRYSCTLRGLKSHPRSWDMNLPSFLIFSLRFLMYSVWLGWIDLASRFLAGWSSGAKFSESMLSSLLLKNDMYENTYTCSGIGLSPIGLRPSIFPPSILNYSMIGF